MSLGVCHQGRDPGRQRRGPCLDLVKGQRWQVSNAGDHRGFPSRSAKGWWASRMGRQSSQDRDETRATIILHVNTSCPVDKPTRDNEAQQTSTTSLKVVLTMTLSPHLKLHALFISTYLLYLGLFTRKWNWILTYRKSGGSVSGWQVTVELPPWKLVWIFSLSQS